MSEIAYTQATYYEQCLKDFVKQGEAEPEYNSLFASRATEINDGPVVPPIGLRAKLPPFKGWGRGPMESGSNQAISD